MKSTISTVKEYLATLPEERRAIISAVREVILDNLPKGYEECINYGMIGYVVPHSIYPEGYHCAPKLPLPFAHIASQKNHMALYFMCLYSDKEAEKKFRDAWLATGKKLDMGKSCIRFKKLEDLPLEVIGKMIASVPVKSYIAHIETTWKRKNKGK